MLLLVFSAPIFQLTRKDCFYDAAVSSGNVSITRPVFNSIAVLLASKSISFARSKQAFEDRRRNIRVKADPTNRKSSGTVNGARRTQNYCRNILDQTPPAFILYYTPPTEVARYAETDGTPEGFQTFVHRRKIWTSTLRSPAMNCCGKYWNILPTNRLIRKTNLRTY